MKKAIISFVISALLGLGVGYLVYEVIMGNSDTPPEAQAKSEPAASEQTTAAKDQTNAKSSDATTTASSTTTSSAVGDDNILAKRGCLGCHSVEALNLKGGQVGPDLSHAFVEVKDKHGMPIEDFLKKPNSAVMSGVLGNNPLTDDQRKQVLDLLQKASEVKQ